jgi:hypothetical protein
VRALARWKRILRKDFLELKRLEQHYPSPHIRSWLKEQEIGQHCCQAGEMLLDPELAVLKQALNLNEQQWCAYRRKVRPSPEDLDDW